MPQNPFNKIWELNTIPLNPVTKKFDDEMS